MSAHLNVVPRKQWSGSEREFLLLRCFFTCTRPDCTNPAIELHHAIPLFKGGSNALDNVMGLCREHHRWVHERPEPEWQDELQKWMTRVQLAQNWLADQVKAVPDIRTSPDYARVARSKLFGEIQQATASPESMVDHLAMVYDRSSWNFYEVFLKASLTYLNTTGNDVSAVCSIILMQMVELYRRRPGRYHHAAARRWLDELYRRIDLACQPPWLRSRATFHQGYLAYLRDSNDDAAAHIFRRSAEEAAKAGLSVSASVSEAQALVVDMRRGADVLDRVWALANKMAAFDDTAAQRWAQQNIPIKVAEHMIRHGRLDEAGALLQETIADIKNAAGRAGFDPKQAIYLLGLVEAEQMRTSSVELLEDARRAYYAASTAEGSAGVLTSLGDTYWRFGDKAAAVDKYREALARPDHMDNRRAQGVARIRLRGLAAREGPPQTIFCPS